MHAAWSTHMFHYSASDSSLPSGWNSKQQQMPDIMYNNVPKKQTSNFSLINRIHIYFSLRLNKSIRMLTIWYINMFNVQVLFKSLFDTSGSLVLIMLVWMSWTGGRSRIFQSERFGSWLSFVVYWWSCDSFWMASGVQISILLHSRPQWKRISPMRFPSGISDPWLFEDACRILCSTE